MPTVSNDYIDSYNLRTNIFGSISDLYTIRSFDWIPSYQSPKNTEFRLLRNKFGDGYEQRIGDGINNEEESWDLVFNSVDSSTAETMDLYLKSKKSGESFVWTPNYLNPSSEKFKVICTKYKINPVGYNIYDISLTFDRVFGE